MDLKDTAIKHKVEVYSYVGDEAILAWQVKDGIEDNNCLQSYYDFNDRLIERSDYYNEKYGLVPEFKAGVHLGEATIAQVGSIVKTSIDYLGDVMNTCARIEGECNTYEKNLLLSEDLAMALGGTDRFEFLGELQLRGKSQGVKVYHPRDDEEKIKKAS